MMSNEELEPRLQEALRAYNSPPPPPLERMWQAIEQTHFGATVHTLSARARTWLPMSLAAAAALVLGIAIGHFGPMPGSEPEQVADVPEDPPSLTSPVSAATLDGEFRTVDAAYNMTANRYLGQAAALLAVLPGVARIDEQDVAQQVDAHFAGQAGDLLSTTRMLLASPEMEDPRFHDLLSDLELVLAQVAGLSPTRTSEELRLITAAVRQHDVMSRLRRAAVSTADGNAVDFDAAVDSFEPNGRGKRAALKDSM